MTKTAKYITTALLTLLLAAGLGWQPVVAQSTGIHEPAPIDERIGRQAGMTPVKIVIPVLDLFVTVESVGRTAEGNMDVPTDWQNVAWYERGFAPGESGRVALAGHLDWQGQAGPFWGLSELDNGSLIALVGEEGRILIYRTISNTRFDRLTQASSQVFGPAEGSILSLITCDGEFLESEDTYTHRQVVEAELIYDTENPKDYSAI